MASGPRRPGDSLLLGGAEKQGLPGNRGRLAPPTPPGSLPTASPGTPANPVRKISRLIAESPRSGRPAPHRYLHGWSLDVEADGRSATVRAPGPGHRHHLDRHRHSQDRRARRARLFCDAYGLQDRGELVDKILERQRAGRRAIKQAADAGDPACQRLWDMGAGAGVQRQIGDVLAHRSALQDALT